MTTTNNVPPDPQTAIDEALKESKNNAFSILLQHIFFQHTHTNGDSLPTKRIGYACMDSATKTILINTESPKDFLSTRKYTSYDKVVASIKYAYAAHKGKTKILDKITEADLDTLISERLRHIVVTSDSNLIRHEAVGDKEARNRLLIIKGRADKVNAAMHSTNAMTQNFSSVVKAFSQDIDKILAKYPDDTDIQEIAVTIKSIGQGLFSHFSEYDYVKFSDS